MAKQARYQRRKVTPLRRAKWTVQRKWRAFKALSKKKKALIIATPILAFLIITPLATYIYYYNDIADKSRLMNANNTGVALLDNHGKEYYSVGRATHRDIVPIDKISDHVEHALIASEDKDFYKNNGFSITGIIRALWGNLTSQSISGGGSTITQQLAKTALLTDRQTLLRKYQELTIAIAIEQRYSKDDILDMYLNSVFFGGTTFGIEEAAKFYFDTTPDKLDLAQSAMLIGILPAPNAYSPTLGNPEYAKERQQYVLDRMEREGYITAEQEKAAYAQKLAYAEPAQEESTVAPAFVQMTLEQLYGKYGGQEKVLRSGFQVTTTLDLTMQKQLEKAVSDHLPYIENWGGSNAAAMAVDPQTGEVRALVGSADWSNPKWGKVNMATTARQPGSSFKTIYYTGALDDGTINPATILHDKPTDFGGYAPKDADRQWRGDVTVRQAISQSLNVPSVEVLQKYGIGQAVSTAHKLGITAIDENKDYGLSLALGTAEAPLSQMVGAYAAIANGGTYHEQTIIASIRDKYNHPIFTAAPSSQQAVSPQAAYLMSSILSDYGARAPIFGGSLSVAGHKVAVKTGTTDDNRDAWTIGFTPSVAVGVWVGNNDNSVMQNGGSGMAGPIWINAMSQYLAGKPYDPYKAPSGIVQRYVCSGTGALANEKGTNTYNEYFMSLHLPTKSCDAEQKPVTIKVCRLSDQKMVTINEDDFDNKKYSKDASDCEKDEPTTIQVCRLSDQEVVTINEDEYNDTEYSKDLSDCDDSTTPITPPDTGNGNGSGNP